VKRGSKLHERLYQEAALKRDLASQIELFSISHLLKSFRPKIQSLNVRDRGNNVDKGGTAALQETRTESIRCENSTFQSSSAVR
jgi:hypothetical protein